MKTLSCRGEGGVAWPGGPLWSPAVLLQNGEPGLTIGNSYRLAMQLDGISQLEYRKARVPIYRVGAGEVWGRLRRPLCLTNVVRVGALAMPLIILAPIPGGTSRRSFVAKQCIHCGKTLPRDNARFCNNCGKEVSTSQPPKHSLSNDPPVWISQLEKSLDMAEVNLSAPEATELPKPLTSAPHRDLHVRVWEQEETVVHSRPEEDRGHIENEQHVVEDLPTEPLSVAGTLGSARQPPSIPNHAVANAHNEELAEDLPTMPLSVTPPETAPALHKSAPSAFGNSNGSVPHLDEVEKLYTSPHMLQRQWQSTSPPSLNPAKQDNGALRPPIDGRQVPGPQRAVTPIVFPQQSPSAHGLRQTPLPPITVPPVAHPQRKGRRGLIFVLILLFILLAGGLSAWIIVFHPFTVPEITNTSQPFQNTELGVSLDYPQTWTAKFDKKNQAIYFYDVNHTDQVNISAVATGGKSIDQYISTVVGSLGMTGRKAGASLSFAGVSWQQEQGSVLQSGATYTAVLLVTMHKGRYYAILQLAPATTYAQEDQLVFSRMRSSLQFV